MVLISRSMKGWEIGRCGIDLISSISRMRRTPQAIPHMTDKAQPRRTAAVVVGIEPVMTG
jgi:hypothetical protein